MINERMIALGDELSAKIDAICIGSSLPESIVGYALVQSTANMIIRVAGDEMATRQCGIGSYVMALSNFLELNND